MRDSLLVLKDLLVAEFLVGVVLQQSTANQKGNSGTRAVPPQRAVFSLHVFSFI